MEQPGIRCHGFVRFQLEEVIRVTGSQQCSAAAPCFNCRSSSRSMLFSLYFEDFTHATLSERLGYDQAT